jgi:alkylation response protein AidB-like acyl-CoA dehydrogenase
MPGVSTRQMNCSGVWASGTSYVTFEDVKVPVENLIGKENKGFKAIMVFQASFKFSTILITREWE